MLISSTRNPVIQAARRLHRRSERLSQGLYLAEGPRLLSAALQTGLRLHTLLYTAEARSGSGRDLVDAARDRTDHLFEVSAPAMRAAAATESPQGILAVLRLPTTLAAEILEGRPVLLLDGWQDPGNTGAAVRSAAAAGWAGVLTAAGGADPFGPKAVRAGAGADFKLAVAGATWEDVRLPRETVWLADPEGETAHTDAPWDECRLLAVGAEHGASAAARAACGRRVRIGMSGSVESLNAAVAAGILCFTASVARSAG